METSLKERAAKVRLNIKAALPKAVGSNPQAANTGWNKGWGKYGKT